MKHGKANRDSESTAFNDFASTTEKVCPIFLFSYLFVVGFVSVFRAITSMAEPSEEEEVKAERINRQCNLQRRVSLHVK